MKDRILKLLGLPEYTPANVPELLDLLHLRPNQQQDLQHELGELARQGLIVRTKGNRYIQAAEADLVPGVIIITRGGKGFVQPDEPGQTEIAIEASATATAMHGDRVLVRRDVQPQGLRKHVPEANTGTVVRVLERKRTQFVGTLQRSKQFLHVTPDDPRLPSAVYVTQPRDVGRPANIGDKVVVEILQWESRQTAPEGEIIEVLGAPDQEGVDMLSVIRHYGLQLHFPKGVLHEANTIAKSRPDNQPSAEECAGRVDCRPHSVITIDPDDAKDFDDAICIEKHGADQWKLWVHIADVSHYVKPGGPLDVEARKRGNSTYLVDRVIPMLPEALSNELCSLKPDLDRLTKCVEFVLSNEGHVVAAKFYAAVIRSKRRFTYKEAFAALQLAPKSPLEEMLHQAHAMAQKVRKLRFKNGSLNLDFPENKIRLDEQGRVLRIERIENDVSHQLIEEFMLLANEAVASRLMGQNRPTVYRIHESPKEQRLNDFRENVLSHRIPCGNLTHRPEVQRLLSRLESLPIGPALKIGFLKSLMRARYAFEPLGHYGLAKEKYTHFTSPIRRYADLVVHRALFEREHLQVTDVKQIAEHITMTERNSADAERDSKEVKLYAFLNAQLESQSPQRYAGLVTDVRNFGFFVEVREVGLSGLVPLSAIPEDFFIFDPVRSQLVGRHTRRIIQLGNEVTVQVHKVDSFKKQVDFALVDERRKPSSPKPHRGEVRQAETPRQEERPRSGASVREKPWMKNRRPKPAEQPLPREASPPPVTAPAVAEEAAQAPRKHQGFRERQAQKKRQGKASQTHKQQSPSQPQQHVQQSSASPQQKQKQKHQQQPKRPASKHAAPSKPPGESQPRSEPSKPAAEKSSFKQWRKPKGPRPAGGKSGRK